MIRLVVRRGLAALALVLLLALLWQERPAERGDERAGTNAGNAGVHGN